MPSARPAAVLAAEIHDPGEKVEVIQILERLHAADSER
jgi:hypothetical protein